MRITQDKDSKKFVDDIEIPDADDVELPAPKLAGELVRSAGEASFAKSYSPESLPKIDLPDLPLDAVSVSAQDLAEIDDSDEEDPLSEPVQALYAPELEAEPEVEPESDPEADAELLAAIQVMKAQADQRAEIMQARMDKLSGQISSLNDKLDRLANISRIEV
jgi:hypothetical protein